MIRGSLSTNASSFKYVANPPTRANVMKTIIDANGYTIHEKHATWEDSFARYAEVGANGIVERGYKAAHFYAGIGGFIEREWFASENRSMLKITCNSTDEDTHGHTRSELQLDGYGDEADFGKLYSYPFSLYIPAAWQIDATTKPVVFQVHQTPDAGDNVANSTPFEMNLEGDHLNCLGRYDANPVSASNGTVQQFATVDWDADTLMEFELIARWSWLSDGYLKLLKDGVTVFEHHGPNCYNDAVGVYVKSGIYHWQAWTAGITQRQLYIGDLKRTLVNG